MNSCGQICFMMAEIADGCGGGGGGGGDPPPVLGLLKTWYSAFAVNFIIFHTSFNDLFPSPSPKVFQYWLPHPSSSCCFHYIICYCSLWCSPSPSPTPRHTPSLCSSNSRLLVLWTPFYYQNFPLILFEVNSKDDWTEHAQSILFQRIDQSKFLFIIMLTIAMGHYYLE